MSGHTAGPYFFREYAQDAEDLEQMRKLGMTPTRMLTNEGQVALMAGTGDDVKRIALINCQTRHKRGEGYKTECAERDANAALFAAVPELVLALEKIEYALRKDSLTDVERVQSARTLVTAAIATLTARKVG